MDTRKCRYCGKGDDESALRKNRDVHYRCERVHQTASEMTAYLQEQVGNKWTAKRVSARAKDENNVSYSVSFEKADGGKAGTPIISPIRLKVSTLPVSKSIKPSASRTALIIPDSQNGFYREGNKLFPIHDRRAWGVAIEMARILQPDDIILLGDMVDLPDWSEKFTLSKDMYFTTQPTILETGYWLTVLRQSNPNSRIRYLEGNHECFSDDTEYLTRQGWVKAPELTMEHTIASWNPYSHAIEFGRPRAIHRYAYDGDLYNLYSRNCDLLVTPNHRIYGRLPGQDYFTKEIQSIQHNRVHIPVSGINSYPEFGGISDDEIRMAAWLLTDGYLKGKSVAISQRESKHTMITNILDRLGWKYSVRFRERTVAEICGKPLVKIPEREAIITLLSQEHNQLHRIRELVLDKLAIPLWVSALSERQFEIFLSSIIDGDGSRHKSAPNTSLMVYGKKSFIDDLQALCVQYGYRSSISEYRPGAYRLNLTKNPETCFDGFQDHIAKLPYNGFVYCATTHNDTLVVRRNGKVVITGNSRMQRLLSRIMIQAQGLYKYGDVHKTPVMSIPNLLDLAALDIEYIGDYPNSQLWLNNNLQVVHGDTVRSDSLDTVKTILKDVRHSVICGHIHRVEYASKTLWHHDGPKIYCAASPGTICDIDGRVPRNSSRVNWQQGLGLVEYNMEGNFQIQLLQIYDSELLFRGQKVKGDSVANAVTSSLIEQFPEMGF